MPEEFIIEPKIAPFLRLFLHSQLFLTPQFPTHSFAGQTVIITGANVGLGLEAARHFYRLNCTKLILAVRTISKGESAKEEIIQSIKHRTDVDAIEIWPLDLASTASTLAFAEAVKEELARVDVLVENAGINSKARGVGEGMELTMQVNVINTFLLALLLLPKLRESARFEGTIPHLTIVTSEAHRLSKFPQVNAEDIYERLNDGRGYNGQSSYEISKLIQILFIRELVSRLKPENPSPASIVLNLVNPGLCVSTLATRDEKSLAARILVAAVYKIIGRTTEVGSRTLVLAASAGHTSNGEYMSDGENQDVVSWIYSNMGKGVQKKVFEQTMKVLEGRLPGIGGAVGI